jgi:hypothetical protein
MTYYCGSCRAKGITTPIPRHRVKGSYFECPREQRKVPKFQLECHKHRPRNDGQTSMDDFC